MKSVILAIESSCDETAASIISSGKVLNNVIASQAVHSHYGGVVPELASRAHQKNIVHVVNEAMGSAGISSRELDAIAFTRGPGLMGSLLVGVSFAKGMSLALEIPLIEVNHMEAHIAALFIDEPKPPFPFLSLTVSGGHTQLVRVNDYEDMQVLGETQDDAVGEAFDKSAKLLGLPYPGGPLIDEWAKKGNPRAFQFAQTVMPGLDFSFSGIKTSFLYFLQDQKKSNSRFIEENMADLCASLQYHLIKMLLEKLQRAVRETGIRTVCLAGGVSANSGLRSALHDLGQSEAWNVFVPRLEYCTDNAAMIAMASYHKFLRGRFSDLEVTPVANLSMSLAS
jgi:N6-L-threonylcarbamoyladenine synthase